MAIQPNTNLYLLKCPLELSNKHQLTFTNKDSQFEYFDSLEKIEIERISYQRKDSFIRFPAHIDSLLEYNYCMYQNDNYNDKWFYAFIVNMEYVNDNMTNIYIKTDVFQTWQFDLIFKQSFIEREMINVSDDIPGANLIPENLETGEYIVNADAEFDDLKPAYIIAYSGNTYNGQAIAQFANNYNGIDSSIVFILCNNTAAYRACLGIINDIDMAGDKILTCFAIPRLAVKDKLAELEIDEPGVTTYVVYPMTSSYMQSIVTKTLTSRPSSINGYTPKNKKLLQYPFLYLGFNPQNGSQNIYRYEDFANGTPIFKLISEINPNPSVYFIPQNYRGQTGDSIPDSCTLNGYPTLSYKNEVFNTWLAQNSNIINIEKEQKNFNYTYNQGQVATGVIGDSAGALASLLNPFSWGQIGTNVTSMMNRPLEAYGLKTNYEYDIAKMNAQIEAQKLVPDKVALNSSNATLLGYELLHKDIFCRYSIKSQFAQRIDKFFDMYGYQTNTVKIPNLNNRPTWNYVKTIGANIEAFIPQSDLSEIISLFDNGITLWHVASKFLDYSQNNR